jgi:hypothetical protein
MMSLENLVSFDEQQNALISHLSSISTNGVFYILKLSIAISPSGSGTLLTLVDPDSAAGAPIDLLKCIELPDLEDGITSCNYIASYGSDMQLEDLKRTFEAILNSCDKTLPSILHSKMLKCPNMKYGPIVYWFLLKQLTSAEDTVIWSIIIKMTNINIADSPGQSITSAVSKIRAAIRWLSRMNMVPKDIVAIVKIVMGTCNVPSFMSLFTAMITNAKLNKIDLNVDKLLSTVKEE